MLVRHAIIGITERALLQAFEFSLYAFPGIDFQREIDRAVFQGLIGGRAERDRLEFPFAAVMANDRGDQRIFPGGAETAIGLAIEILRAGDVGTASLEHQAARFGLHDGIGAYEIGTRRALGKKGDRAENAEVGHVIGNQRSGRGVRVGEEFDVDTLVLVEAFIAGDEKADVIGVRGPVEGDRNF
ncbi:hypothetical protein D3C73_497170 [compost metagenome]